MPDDIITRDSQGKLAVNTVSGTEANVPYNYDDCFTLDTNGRRALRVVGDSASLSSDFINVSKIMPSADAAHANQVHIYTGKTNNTYTHGHIYENVKTATYTDNVTFQPATISGTVVTATTGSLAALCAEWGSGDITAIVSGTLTYDASGNLWILDGKDSGGRNIAHFQLYQDDYEDAGFTFTGTPENDDVVDFVCEIEESDVSYTWTDINS